MIGQRPIHPAVQRALFRKIDAINRLKVGAGDPFFNSTALEPQDQSNPIEQGIFRACWARVTAAISQPGVEGQDLADKPISFGGYFDTEKNTQINRPLTFNKNITKDNIASETFRGESGITGVSVTQKSFYVNQVEISWACPDPIDFEERIEPTFLRHGQLVAVEFGWGMDDKELDYEAAELTTDDMKDLLSDVYTKQLAKAGSYYCNVGTVSNYNYKLGTDGGYTGTITLHTRGQNVMNQVIRQLNWARNIVKNNKQKQNLINSDLKNNQLKVVNHQIPKAIVEGNSSIEAIDNAIKEFYSTGYVHNHVRMYIAAICCNNAKSHWKAPAKWMYYHLLDGDIASNCLNWQWISGASRNKKYLFNQENLTQASNQLFDFFN